MSPTTAIVVARLGVGYALQGDRTNPWFGERVREDWASDSAHLLALRVDACQSSNCQFHSPLDAFRIPYNPQSAPRPKFRFGRPERGVKNFTPNARCHRKVRWIGYSTSMERGEVRPSEVVKPLSRLTLVQRSPAL